MRAVIYYFTGTGNTRWAARHIGEELRKRGVAADLFEVRTPFSAAPDPRRYDIAGFGYPIHAFNTPRFFLGFVKSLPDVCSKKAFIFKTSGEPFAVNNASSFALVRLLRKKGYQPRSETHMLMPYNIMFRYPDGLAKQMALHTAAMAGRAAEDALGPGKRLRFSPAAALVMYVFRLQWLGARLNGPHIHAAPELCKGCGLCAKSCPAGNITMRDGLPRFDSRCTMCMRCAFCCPADAVRPGFLNNWRVNGDYGFARLIADERLPEKFITPETRGYFRKFLRYYERTDTDPKR